MQIAGKRILVTGAGQGMGRLMVYRFAREGGYVIATDLRTDLLDDLKREAKERGVNLLTYTLDVTKRSEILSLRQRIESELKGVDILVNNAGVVFGGPFLEVSLDHHHHTFAVNLLGLVEITHAFLPLLIKEPESAVVNMASASAFIALPNATTYAASKWGVVGFSDSLRAELKGQKLRHVRVITICPSYVNTGMFAGARPPKQLGMLRPETVVESVITAILKDKEEVFVPRVVRGAPFLRGILPKSWFDWLMRKMGIYSSMRGWKGRKPEPSLPATASGESLPAASSPG